MSTDADTATERALNLDPDTTIYVAHGARNGANGTFHLREDCHALTNARVKPREYQHRPLRADCCSYCVRAEAGDGDDARTIVGGDAPGMPGCGRCSHAEDGMVFACESCDEPNPYKRSDESVAEGAARFRCSECEATSDEAVKRESHAHTRGTGAVNGRAGDLIPDGGVYVDDSKFWQKCEIPDCQNDVPRAKGICDSCAGVGGECDVE